MVIPLTKKEKMILEFIRVYSELHGFSPSLYDIAEHFELRAVSTVHEHIGNLKKKGYVIKEASQARSLQLIDATLAGQDVREITLSLQ